MGKTVPEFPYASHPAFFTMNIWHYYSTFVLINEPMLIHHYLKSMLYSYPPSFHLISLFFLLQDPRNPNLFISPPEAPLGCESISNFPCFQCPWHFWGVLGRHIVRRLVLKFVWCFPLGFTGVMGFWKITEVQFCSYHILWRVWYVSMTYPYLCWPWPPAEAMFVRVLCWKATLSPPFCTVLLGRTSFVQLPVKE